MDRLLMTGLLTMALGLVGACTFVPLDPGAAQVALLSPQGAEGCERIGVTRVEVLAKVMGIRRNPDKMSNQLDTLARNSAAEMEGNAVVPEGGIEDGKRRYVVYRCQDR